MHTAKAPHALLYYAQAAIGNLFHARGRTFKTKGGTSSKSFQRKVDEADYHIHALAEVMPDVEYFWTRFAFLTDPDAHWQEGLSLDEVMWLKAHRPAPLLDHPLPCEKYLTLVE